MGSTSGSSNSPVVYKTVPRHQLQRRGASKPSDPRGDQPFPGLLRPGTFSLEELVDVLRAAVVDRKGEGWEGQVPRDPEGEVSSPEPSEDLVRYFTKTCGVTSWFSHSRTSLAATSHVLSLPQHHGMQLWRGITRELCTSRLSVKC